MDCKSIQAFLSFAHDDDSVSAFIDDLIAALQREDIVTFRPDRTLETEDKSVPSDSFEAIQKSKICIVVFTPYYVNSVWCLEELAKISLGIVQRLVLPIFYRVYPAELQKESDDYKDAFTKHEEKFKDNLVKVQKWRLAMKHVASLRRWHAWFGSESKLIDHIVKYIMKMFGRDGLVGMETRVRELDYWLVDLNDDVQVVGIYGMCGIGKTCLAQVIYDRIYHQFDAHCFLFNDGQFDCKPYIRHQEQLYLSLMDDNEMKSSPEERILFVRNQLSCRKTLLVIDDVDKLEQLEVLTENYIWFHPGSRIIITTRDKNILRRCRVEKIMFYNVKLLNEKEALQLFCRCAFKCDYLVQGYEEFTHYILKYASGLPLAIQSLGSTLLGKSPLEWKSFLKNLEEHPDKNIMRLLKSSLDGLSSHELEIFLDIACFFNGKCESYVMGILDSCGFFPQIGITVLQDKSLINIKKGKIWMHNLLQQVGREIVRQESDTDPGQRTRLWLIKDFLNVAATENGINNKVKAIVLTPEVLERTPLKVEALTEMKELRLLIIHNVNFVGELRHLSWNLRYISWYKYPHLHLPLSFGGIQLVELIMSHSNITQLWKGVESLIPTQTFFPKLRNLDLHGSKYLIEMPNFTRFPNLERLDLEECRKLLKVDSSIATLQKLKFLNLRNCIGLISIPNNLFDLSSLDMLNLAGCSNLQKYLNFYPLRSSLEVKLLSKQYHPFLAKLLSRFHYCSKNKLVSSCF